MLTLSSRVLPIMVKSKQKKVISSGHTVCTVRKQREINTCTQLAFSFACSLEPKPREWCCPNSYKSPSSRTSENCFLTWLRRTTAYNSMHFCSQQCYLIQLRNMNSCESKRTRSFHFLQRDISKELVQFPSVKHLRMQVSDFANPTEIYEGL